MPVSLSQSGMKHDRFTVTVRGETWRVHCHSQRWSMMASLSQSEMKHDGFTVTTGSLSKSEMKQGGFTVTVRGETWRLHCHDHGWNMTASLSKAAVKHDWYMVYCHTVVRQGCFTVTIDLRRDWFKVTVKVRHDRFNVTVDVKHDWFNATKNVIKTRLAYCRGQR